VEYVLGVIAAALLGAGFVLQQDAAQQTPNAHFLRAQLVGDLLRRPRWLLGFGTMVAGQLLSAWVIGHMVLSLAEPLLATNLLFALLLAGPLSGQRLHKSEAIGAVILMAGVTALSLARSVRSPTVYVGSSAYWPFAGAAVVFLALAFAELGRRRRANQRALLTAISAGLVLGIADAITRRTVQLLDTGHLAVVLTSWPAYSLVGVNLVGLWLMQSAFSAGPLHTSLPGITATEPVVGIVMGLVVFRDSLHISPEALGLEDAGLAALIVGVVLVARAPALAQLRKFTPLLADLPGKPRPGPPGEASSGPPGEPGPGPAQRPPALAGPALRGIRERVHQRLRSSTTKT
jgi:drug/metabolite transporter (DMT)-like permease